MATPAATAVLPDDILTAIFELARQEAGKDRLRFRGHDEDLQRIFWELSKQEKYDLLRHFAFSTYGPRPYSPLLSDSVSKLQLAGLLGRENPQYEVLFTTAPARDFFDSVLSKKFSPDQLNQLKEIAKHFAIMAPPV